MLKTFIAFVSFLLIVVLAGAGGGIYVFGSGAPTLSSLIVTRSHASAGGGMVVNAATSPTLTYAPDFTPWQPPHVEPKQH